MQSRWGTAYSSCTRRQCPSYWLTLPTPFNFFSCSGDPQKNTHCRYDSKGRRRHMETTVQQPARLSLKAGGDGSPRRGSGGARGEVRGAPVVLFSGNGALVRQIACRPGRKGRTGTDGRDGHHRTCWSALGIKAVIAHTNTYTPVGLDMRAGFALASYFVQGKGVDIASRTPLCVRGSCHQANHVFPDGWGDQLFLLFIFAPFFYILRTPRTVDVCICRGGG